MYNSSTDLKSSWQGQSSEYLCISLVNLEAEDEGRVESPRGVRHQPVERYKKKVGEGRSEKRPIQGCLETSK